MAVAHQNRQITVAADGDSETISAAATAAFRRMRPGFIIGIALDVSSTVTGGVCDALAAVDFHGFSVVEHASNILFGCAAHANRVREWAPTKVRASMRQLIICHSLPVAARPPALVTHVEPRRDRLEVLANSRLPHASCPAFSKAQDVKRVAATSATNVEESLHERVLRLGGRRQSQMVASSGDQIVDTNDLDEMEYGRAAGARTSSKGVILAERRKEAPQQKRGRASAGRGAPAGDEAEDSDSGLVEPPLAPTRRPRKRKTEAAPAAGVAAVESVAARRIFELGNEVLQQRNRSMTSKFWRSE